MKIKVLPILLISLFISTIICSCGFFGTNRDIVGNQSDEELIRQFEARRERTERENQIVRVSRELPAGTKISKDDLTLNYFNEGYPPEGSFNKFESAIGRVVKNKIASDTILNEKDLMPLNDAESEDNDEKTSSGNP